jgi:AraC-like DNA-binding protein
VEEAARYAGVSRSCLYRAFQAEFGCSPSAYLIRFRIQRACQLLRHSALPVGAVALSVGFGDPYYFSRAFRREMGVSPTEYREDSRPAR